MYYHGSKNPNIKILKANYNKDGKVYVTSNIVEALVYASREYVNLFVTGKDGVVKFLEYKENLFKTLYNNKKGYIYVLEDKNYIEVKTGVNCSASSAFYISEDVKILDVVKIDNVYEEFLKYEKEGKFVLISSDNMDDISRNNVIKGLKETILKHKSDERFMRYVKKYFDDLI